MLSNFIVAVGAVFPIFVLITIGLIVKHAHLLTREELVHLNRLVFRVFFFFMLFSNIYKADFVDGFAPRLMLFGGIAVTLLFLGRRRSSAAISSSSASRSSSTSSARTPPSCRR